MSSHEANFEVFSAVAVLGLALLLAGVALLSYHRLRHARALWIGVAFLVFAAKGAYLLRESWASRGSEGWLLPVAAADLLVLLLLYLALRIR